MQRTIQSQDLSSNKNMQSFRWEKHGNYLLQEITNFYENGVNVDCTLLVEEQYIKGHKLILCAASPYFQTLLSDVPGDKPVVLQNVRYQDVERLLKLIYTGSVDVPTLDVESFIKTAKSLQVVIFERDDYSLVSEVDSHEQVGNVQRCNNTNYSSTRSDQDGEDICDNDGGGGGNNNENIPIYEDITAEKSKTGKIESLSPQMISQFDVTSNNNNDNVSFLSSTKKKTKDTVEENGNFCIKVEGCDANMFEHQLSPKDDVNYEGHTNSNLGREDDITLHRDFNISEGQVRKIDSLNFVINEVSSSNAEVFQSIVSKTLRSSDPSLNSPAEYERTLGPVIDRVTSYSLCVNGKDVNSSTSCILSSTVQEPVDVVCKIEIESEEQNESSDNEEDNYDIDFSPALDPLDTCGASAPLDAQMMQYLLPLVKMECVEDMVDSTDEMNRGVQSTNRCAYAGRLRCKRSTRDKSSMKAFTRSSQHEWKQPKRNPALHRSSTVNLRKVASEKHELRKPICHDSEQNKKLFRCSFCSAIFEWKSLLARHRRAHHRDAKPFFCTLCPATFSRNSILKKHLYTHSGDKPYVCDICSTSFVQKSDLTIHERVHTGEKPFQCDVCSKAFNRQNDLKLHQYTHTGERPFMCQICPAAFIKKSRLKTHLLIHTVENTSMEGCD